MDLMNAVKEKCKKYVGVNNIGTKLVESWWWIKHMKLLPEGGKVMSWEKQAE